MKIGTLQKGSLAALLWLILYIYTSATVYDFVWTADRTSEARRAGRLGADRRPPLSLWAAASIYAAPTCIVGLLVALYRRGTRHKL
jgi:hypothetical protein